MDLKSAAGREIVLKLIATADIVSENFKTEPIQKLGLDYASLGMLARAIKVDDQCRTSMRNVWAIGDLTSEPMLTHRAMAQGKWWPKSFR